MSHVGTRFALSFLSPIKLVCRLAGLLFCIAAIAMVYAQETPPADAFRVMPASSIVEGPSVTPYLKYQTELA